MSEVHSLLTRLQICISTAFSRFVGLSRLVMTFSPVPLKKPPRHVIVVTERGGLMLWSSAPTRAVIPFAAA